MAPLSLRILPRPSPARVGKDDSFRRKRTDTRQGQQALFVRSRSPSLALVHQAHVARRTVEVIQLHFGYNSSLGPEGGPFLRHILANSEFWGTDTEYTDGMTF